MRGSCNVPCYDLTHLVAPRFARHGVTVEKQRKSGPDSWDDVFMSPAAKQLFVDVRFAAQE